MNIKKGELFTHVEKGGRYKTCGMAKGTGVHNGSVFVIYTNTFGEVFNRELSDFNAKMTRVEL